MEGDGRDSGLQPASPADEADRGRFGQFQHLLSSIPSHKAYSLIGYVVRRFSRDSCPSVAASLSYTSLLALVPMMAIGLAMFAAFPAFSNMRDTMLRALIENAAPSLAVLVEEHLQTFIRNAGQTTGVGILGLAVTALLLINTIQTAFDRIWGGGRGFKIQRFPVYWALLTLGPILFGIAFSISSYAFALAQSAGLANMSIAVRLYAALAPFLLEAVGFLLFYRLMPTRPVRWMDAATGAVIAAGLFEILKRAFGIYLGFLGTYQTLYGALATLPIFLIWMYLGWLVVLIGAEITASLPEWRSGRRDPDERPRRGDMLGLALGALASLRSIQSTATGGEKIDYLSRQLDAEIGKLTHVMDMLRGARFIVRSDNNRWVLARDLNEVTLNDLVGALNLSMADVQDCPKQTMSVMTDLAAAERSLLDRTIEDCLKSHGLL
jgi:membrane protein